MVKCAQLLPIFKLGISGNCGLKTHFFHFILTDFCIINLTRLFNMQSPASTVTEYLNEVPADRKAAITHLRDLCLTLLIGFDEAMGYGMPVYLRNGVVELGFASQKHFIALYVLNTGVMDAHRHLLTGKGISLGKGCIRYSKPERIDFEVVAKLLRAAQQASGPICD